ncbi:MAG: hypothetical protein K6G11_08325, partial [Lachnospiraceae bacterium]|nr:hypothetical protein [Lachnospiraceae bacterium]
ISQTLSACPSVTDSDVNNFIPISISFLVIKIHISNLNNFNIYILFSQALESKKLEITNFINSTKKGTVIEIHPNV